MYVRGPRERRRKRGVERVTARARKMQQLTHTAAERNDERDTRPDRTRASKCSSACSQTQQPAPLAQRVRSPSSLIRSTTRVSRRRRRPPLVVVDVVVVVVPRRVRLTNLVPPEASTASSSHPLLVPLFLRFCRALSRSATLLSRSTHRPTKPLVPPARRLSPPARARQIRSAPLHRFSPLFLREPRLRVFFLHARDYTEEKKERKKKKRRKKGGEGTKESFSRVLSSFFFPLSSFVSPFVGSFGSPEPALRDYLLSDRTFLRACLRASVRACVRLPVHNRERG